MGVISAVVGAATPDGATFVCKVAGPVRVAVSTSADMASPVFTSSQAVDAQGVAKVSITGLNPDTDYWWQVEDNSVLDTTVTGRFHTLPGSGTAASFTFVAIGDSGLEPDFPGVAGTELDNTRVSNHPIYDTIRTQAHALGWAGLVHMGDAHYYNLGTDFTASLTNFRRAWDDILAQPNAAGLLREVALWSYVWDDHDFDGNNSDGTFVDKANAAQVYRERIPHPPLATTGAVYHSWQVGRVLFVTFDTRYDRSPNTDPDTSSKVMLGSAQRTWLQSTLDGSDAKALVMLMPSQWLGTTEDSWSQFATERATVAGILTSAGWAHRAVMVSADTHGIGLISAGGNPHGGWPILHCAAIDASPSGGGAQYDLGYQGGRSQYGTVQVVDHGTHIVFTLTGWANGTAVMSYSYGVSISSPTEQSAAQVREFADIVSGSHRAIFEARVLSTFQTGDDPDGELIDILGGAVEMDGTADIQRTLRLVTDGGQFPRRTGDLLLPDSTEIFVRRGVNIGSELRWAPLGYFRIEEPEQDDAPGGPISIAAYDRMKGIIDSPLLAPIQFAATASFGGVFAALVLGVYPDATILFDDDLGSEQIGRTLVVERSRYEPLKTLAHGRGKILYWDGQGNLRVETAPDPSQPVWEVAAGVPGVLTRAKRRITRTDVVNAIVVRSQGLDALEPARAVAIDDGSNSITRFGGRFGVVPDFLTVPAETTLAQAQEAARLTLLRRAGLPFQVEFAAIPNPALQPYDPVRVTLRDGNREKHVVERLSMPLMAAEQMSARTREQRGSLIRAVTL